MLSAHPDASRCQSKDGQGPEKILEANSLPFDGHLPQAMRLDWV